MKSGYTIDYFEVKAESASKNRMYIRDGTYLKRVQRVFALDIFGRNKNLIKRLVLQGANQSGAERLLSWQGTFILQTASETHWYDDRKDTAFV